jgi:hypothetical protein
MSQFEPVFFIFEPVLFFSLYPMQPVKKLRCPHFHALNFSPQAAISHLPRDPVRAKNTGPSKKGAHKGLSLRKYKKFCCFIPVLRG